MYQLPSSLSNIRVDQKCGLLPTHLPVPYIFYFFFVSFQTLFECGTQPGAEYALKPLCNAETQWGVVYLEDKVLPGDYSALGLRCCLINC